MMSQSCKRHSSPVSTPASRPPRSLKSIWLQSNSIRLRGHSELQSGIYNTLDRRRNQIRVATIIPSSDNSLPVRVSLETVSLNDDDLEFEALSYCWGDPSVKEDIIIDGISWPVTTNLKSALSAFRSHAATQKVRIWIDAICINQDDKTEQEWQVTLMGEVYARASNVRTWLGSGDVSGPDRTALAFEQLRLFTSNLEDEVAIEDIPRCLKILAELFRNPYWHRRWITQEIVLARKISIYCGSSLELDVDLRRLHNTLSQVATYLQMAYPYQGDREVWDVVDHDKGIWKNHQPVQHILNAISPVTAFDKPLTKHPYLLRDIRGAEQTKDHDCVYGILGLLKRDLGHTLVAPDYKLPIEDVFEDFAYKLMTASKSLAFLYEAYPEDRRLATWVPDLRITSRDNNRYIPDEVQLELSPDAGFSSATFRTGIRFPDAATQRRTNTLAQLDHLFDASAGSKFFAALPATGVIHLHGLFVDHVIDCTAHDKGLGNTYPTTLMEGWVPMDWMDMYTTAKKYSSRLHEDQFEDECLIRTLSADCTWPTDSSSPRRLTTQEALDYRQDINPQRDSPGLTVQHPTAFLDASMSLYKFFSTKDGSIGITYGDVQDGDLIVVVASLNMPIIVRGSRYADADDIATARQRTLLDPAYRGRSLTTYKLIGSCYVHGIMDGEAVIAAAEDRWCRREEVFEDLFLI